MSKQNYLQVLWNVAKQIKTVSQTKGNPKADPEAGRCVNNSEL